MIFFIYFPFKACLSILHVIYSLFPAIALFQFFVCKKDEFHRCKCKVNYLLNNQPDALIIQIYSVIELYIFRASSLPIIRSFLLYIRHW